MQPVSSRPLSTQAILMLSPMAVLQGEAAAQEKPPEAAKQPARSRTSASKRSRPPFTLEDDGGPLTLRSSAEAGWNHPSAELSL